MLFVSETQPCFTARISARPGARPECRLDGTYAPVQCHVETGYCWCVTAQGRPIPDTSMKHDRPRCPRRGGSTSTRSAQRRRSPAFRNHKQLNNNRHRNTCDRTEKLRFNNNLIENFKIEYRRTNISIDGQFYSLTVSLCGDMMTHRMSQLCFYISTFKHSNIVTDERCGVLKCTSIPAQVIKTWSASCRGSL